MALDPTDFTNAMATYLASHDLSIALRRGLTSNLPSGLLQAEPYYSTDGKVLYVGNGDGSATPFLTEDGADLIYSPKASPTFTGLVTTAGQVKFPATQNASSDVNTLDDYEEGTFTPTAYGSTAAGTPTYSIRFGYYTKIGRIVHFSIFIGCTAHTGTGKLYIGGLPFAANGLHPVAIGYVAYLTIGSTALTAYVENGATFIKIGNLASGTTPTLIDMDGSFELTLTGTYMV
jgi:hypothetical protein